jgi:hypothetical protein
MPGKKSMLYHADDPHTTEKKQHTTRNRDGEVKTSKPHTHNPETGEGVLPYKPFKMMGHTLPGIKQRGMPLHDGKEFGDEGFMDTHFKSGKARDGMPLDIKAMKGKLTSGDKPKLSVGEGKFSSSGHHLQAGKKAKGMPMYGKKKKM